MSDGTDLLQHHWNNGEPDDSWQGEDVAALDLTNGKWIDTARFHVNSVVCERVPGQNKILKSQIYQTLLNSTSISKNA